MKASFNDDRSGHLSGEHGFTLIEVLIAITIFSVGILAIGSMQTSALKGNSGAGGLTQAVQLAQRQIENLMSIEYDPSSPADELDPAQNASHTFDETIFGNTYTVNWTVTAHPSIADAVTIEVTVAWADWGMNKRITYDLIRTNMI